MFAKERSNLAATIVARGLIIAALAAGVNSALAAQQPNVAARTVAAGLG